MRLIDADALLAEAMADGAYGYVDAKQIADAPTIDAVPVVRCKDCKHSHPWYADKSICELWTETGADVFNDGFCSYGERKEE